MFGFATTVDEVIDGVDLTGKTAVVTGASSGLGLQTVATWPRPARTLLRRCGIRTASGPRPSGSTSES